MSDDQDGCEWVSFFWYRPPQVDQRPLNGCVCEFIWPHSQTAETVFHLELSVYFETWRTKLRIAEWMLASFLHLTCKTYKLRNFFCSGGKHWIRIFLFKDHMSEWHKWRHWNSSVVIWRFLLLWRRFYVPQLQTQTNKLRYIWFNRLSQTSICQQIYSKNIQTALQMNTTFKSQNYLHNMLSYLKIKTGANVRCKFLVLLY